MSLDLSELNLNALLALTGERVSRYLDTLGRPSDFPVPQFPHLGTNSNQNLKNCYRVRIISLHGVYVRVGGQNGIKNY